MSNAVALQLAENYRETILAAATLAAAAINPILDSAEGLAFGPWTRQMRPPMLEISNIFGVAAAEAASAYYDETRALFPPTDAGIYRAGMLVNPALQTKRYQDNIAYAFNGVPTAKSYAAVKDGALMAVQNNVKQASFGNMVENVRKDRALVVITYIPSSKACRFCRSIISQGRTNYRSVAGDSAYGGSAFMASIYKNGSQFHNRCACTPMPRFVTSQGEGDYDTAGQQQFNKDFKDAAKQANTLGISMNTPRETMDVMDVYQKSYTVKNPGQYWAYNPKNPPTYHANVQDGFWGNIIGPKFGADHTELMRMKSLLAGNNWKPFVIPITPKK